MKTLDGLPDSPELYEKELAYWPWGLVHAAIAEHVSLTAPRRALVLDLMCGTGSLLGKISELRPDLELVGVSATESYLEFGRARFPKVELLVGDARRFESDNTPSVVICAAGLHHLAPEDQSPFLEHVASMLSEDGEFLLAEEVLADFSEASGRVRSVVRLWTHVLAWLADRNAPLEVTMQACRVMLADLGQSEWKSTRSDLVAKLSRTFKVVREVRYWPEEDVDYGDFIFWCRRDGG